MTPIASKISRDLGWMTVARSHPTRRVPFVDEQAPDAAPLQLCGQQEAGRSCSDDHDLGFGRPCWVTVRSNVSPSVVAWSQRFWTATVGHEFRIYPRSPSSR